MRLSKKNKRKLQKKLRKLAKQLKAKSMQAFDYFWWHY